MPKTELSHEEFARYLRGQGHILLAMADGFEKERKTSLFPDIYLLTAWCAGELKLGEDLAHEKGKCLMCDALPVMELIDSEGLVWGRYCKRHGPLVLRSLEMRITQEQEIALASE